MNKDSFDISFAVINLTNDELFDHTIKFLHKFNISKILLIKKIGLRINTKILKKYNISFEIIKTNKKKNLYENLIIFKKKLPIFFFYFDTNDFLNFNLFELKELIKKNPKKLIYFKNKFLLPSLKIINKKKLNFYKNIHIGKLSKKNYKKISFKKKDFIFLNKKNNKKKIDNFFRKIYSKNLILDRDGVINKDLGYVSSISKFKWISGATKAIRYLNKKKYNIFIATNQSGVARGFYSEKKVILLHQHIKNLLQKKNCYINQFYYCPFHSDGRILKYRKNSNLRKPKNGMFLEIKKDWSINPKQTFMIGDQQSDISFAKNSKIKSYLFNEKNLYLFVKKFF